jgi:hypothetical protein
VDTPADGMREIAVEAWNIVFGRAMFVYLRLPDEWVTGFQINEPLVCNRFLYKNLVWAGTGETDVLISRMRGKGGRPVHEFTLKVVAELQKRGPVAPDPKDLASRHEKKGHRVLDSGKLNAGGHVGSYILWTTSRHRLRVIGLHRPGAKLEGYIPCTETTRLLKLTWTSPVPNLVIDHSAWLIASLNSVLCHGHDTQLDEAVSL